MIEYQRFSLNWNYFLSFFLFIYYLFIYLFFAFLKNLLIYKPIKKACRVKRKRSEEIFFLGKSWWTKFHSLPGHENCTTVLQWQGDFPIKHLSKVAFATNRFQLYSFNSPTSLSVAFYIVISYCSVKQMTGFYMKCNTGMKCWNGKSNVQKHSKVFWRF